MKYQEFRELVWQKGHELYREMPWRSTPTPYFVLVSEIMLQQTQVERVRVKFAEFMARFPTIEQLAKVPLADVLQVWSGLGYNRRAKFLHEAAKKVVHEYDGIILSTMTELVSLPGVGGNTAGAVLAYSYSQPVVFIETNIRTVYFTHFFEDQTRVADANLRAIVEKTLDTEHPREWYWALMDYGAFLKKQGGGRLDQSKHYKKQAPLKGSIREIRGAILKQLVAHDLTKTQLMQAVPHDERFEPALDGLLKDGLVVHSADRLHLTR